jgi:glucose/arabinose dehydrogenase
LLARVAASALTLLAGASPVLAQGSQHALRFAPATPSPQHVAFVIDDDRGGPDASTPLDVGSGDFTIEFWIRGTAAANPLAGLPGDLEVAAPIWKEGHRVIDRALATGGAEFGVSLAGGHVRFGTGAGATPPFDTPHTLEGDRFVLDGAWHHVACARDAASGEKRIFVDGELDVASAPLASRADLSYPDAGLGIAPPRLILGAALDGAGAAFVGEIDEIRFWTTAANPTLVLSRFDRQVAATANGLVAWYRCEEGQGAILADASAASSPPGALAPGGASGIPAFTSHQSEPGAVAPISTGLLPPGFQRTTITTDLVQPTCVEVLPAGSHPGGDAILIAERGGALKLVLASAPAPITIHALAVDAAGGERGLLGMTLHPDFVQNGHVYLFHTAPGPVDRLSRITLASLAVVPGSEVVIYDAPAPASEFHHGGGLEFGADGKLYVGLGDQLDSAHAPALASPFGKVLRLEDDGQIPPDNPFVGVAGARPEIFARGVRNPFRISRDAATGELLLGDVGGNTSNSREEIDRLVSGADYGWPFAEGAACFVTECSSYAPPIFDYRHDDPDFSFLFPQGSITLGPIYRGASFPASYDGNVFFGDFAMRAVRRVIRDGAGKVVAAPIFVATGLARTVVDLALSPAGSLYVLAVGSSSILYPDAPVLHRIAYVGVQDAPPLAVASGTPLEGPAPLQVAFSSAGSLDPEGQPLLHAWSFGDGTHSTLPAPRKTYAAPGRYIAQLVVSDGVKSTSGEPLIVEVGGKPQPSILAPAQGAQYEAGQTIAFVGAATDPEDGALSSASLAFEVLLVHGDHVHPFQTPAAGASGSFVVPTTGHAPGGTHFLIRLTATDSHGLTASTAVEIFRDDAALALATLPAGLPLALDGEPILTPHVAASVDGFAHHVAAPLAAELGGAAYVLRCWSDGGAPEHVIVAPEGGINATAVYDLAIPLEVSPAIPVPERAAQWQAGSGTTLSSPLHPGTLALGQDLGGPFASAMQFPLAVPPGAVVLSAHLDVTGSGQGGGQPSVTIRAFAAATLPPFTAGPAPLGAFAPLGASQIAWTVPALPLATNASSPNLAPLLQEVVDRADWQAGGYFGLLLDGAGNAQAHHWYVAGQGSPPAPRLRVRYVLPAPSGGCAPPCGFTTIAPGNKAADRLALIGAGSPSLGHVALLRASGLPASTYALLFASLSTGNAGISGGTFLLGFQGFIGSAAIPAQGGIVVLPLPLPATPSLAFLAIHFQAIAPDPAAPFGAAFSNGLTLTLCP